MNILYLAHRIPYPPDKGEKIRSFNQIRCLAQRHALTLGFLVDHRQDLQYVEPLQAHCRALTFACIRPLLAKAKSLLGLPQARPLTLSYFYSRKLDQNIRKLLAAEKFDVIVVNCSAMAQYVPENCSVPAVMDFVDVDSDKWRQYARHGRGLRRWIYQQEARRMAAFERRISKSFAASVVVSQAESDLLHKVAGVPGQVVGNGIDFDYFSSLPQRQREQAVLFIGTMDYLPNIEGVIHFHRHSWPLIRASCPQARLYIVGRNPVAKILALQSADVEVTGTVADIREYLAQARVGIAPLQLARGLQNKVLEYLAAGLPVVASPQALQGIEIDGMNQAVWCESDNEKFARRVISCLNEEITIPPQRQERLRQRYSWERHVAGLESILRHAAGEASVPFYYSASEATNGTTNGH